MQSGMSLTQEAELTHDPPYPRPEVWSHVRAAWHSELVLTCVDQGGQRLPNRYTPAKQYCGTSAVRSHTASSLPPETAPPLGLARVLYHPLDGGALRHSLRWLRTPQYS